MNNIIFTTLILIIASLCIFNKNTIEGFSPGNVSGTHMKHAYIPQQFKNRLPIRNTQPHGSTQQTEVRQLETFNYNPRQFRSNVNQVEQQFKNIERFQVKNNMGKSNRQTHNKHEPQKLPQHNMSETYIPKREEYQMSRGMNVSSVTPEGYRNGAKPSYGVDLVRRSVVENFSTPQFGVPGNTYGNLKPTIGSSLNPNALVRGKMPFDMTQLPGMAATSANTGNSSGTQQYTPPSTTRIRGNNRNMNLSQQYTPPSTTKIRGNNRNMAAPSENYKPKNQLLVGKQQYHPHNKRHLLI